MNNVKMHRISVVLKYQLISEKLLKAILAQGFYEYVLEILYMSFTLLSHAINKLPTGKRLKEWVFGHPFLQSPVDNL